MTLYTVMIIIYIVKRTPVVHINYCCVCVYSTNRVRIIVSFLYETFSSYLNIAQVHIEHGVFDQKRQHGMCT